eukprot:7331807-Pyramimonas_sp.AAC.2
MVDSTVSASSPTGSLAEPKKVGVGNLNIRAKLGYTRMVSSLFRPEWGSCRAGYPGVRPAGGHVEHDPKRVLAQAVQADRVLEEDSFADRARGGPAHHDLHTVLLLLAPDVLLLRHAQPTLCSTDVQGETGSE